MKRWVVKYRWSDGIWVTSSDHDYNPTLEQAIDGIRLTMDAYRDDSDLNPKIIGASLLLVEEDA